jgi:hypothetical protein
MTMSDAIEASGPADEDIFVVEVSDTALEAAAGASPLNASAFTVNLCTVMADCYS